MNVDGNTFGYICLSLCVYSSCSNFRKHSPRNIIFGMQIHLQNIFKVIGSRSRSQEQKTGFTSVTKYTHSLVICLRLDGKLVQLHLTFRRDTKVYLLNYAGLACFNDFCSLSHLCKVLRWLEVDQYYRRQKCNPGNLVFWQFVVYGNISGNFRDRGH